MCDEWVVADVTKHNLARLIAAQQALSAAIARVESPESAKPPPPPAGMRWLVPPRHALTPNHVGDARPVEVTLARFLLWRALLTHRQPTTQSLVRAHGLLRGLAIKRLAQIRRGKAETPPLKPDAPGVPAMTARSAVSRAATQTRAEGDLNPGDVSFENGELSPDDAAFLDELDYYDVWGDATGVPVDEMMDATGQNLAPDEERAIGATLSWDRLISNLTTIFPSDLQIAQAIDAAWNGAVIEWAGQTTFDAAGLVGTFDIRDPWFLDYLREQSGFWITGIDESTRLVVSQTLWDMLGGNADFWAPAGSRGPDTVARWLQRWSNVYENDLADMSSYRALMIAYTETARAETFGTFVSLWQSGARQKVWIANPGACVYCVTNVEEGPIPLTQPFPTGHQSPPIHPLDRCSISAWIPDGPFNPDDWRPRPAGALEGLLGSWDGAAWPATDLSFLDDVELPGVDLAARPSVTRSRVVKTATPKRRTVPPHPLSRDAFLALGVALAPALEHAGRAWLAALSLDLPRDVEGVSALTKRIAKLPRERVHAADSAYLRRLRQAIERAGALKG